MYGKIKANDTNSLKYVRKQLKHKGYPLYNDIDNNTTFNLKNDSFDEKCYIVSLEYKYKTYEIGAYKERFTIVNDTSSSNSSKPVEVTQELKEIKVDTVQVLFGEVQLSLPTFEFLREKRMVY